MQCEPCIWQQQSDRTVMLYVFLTDCRWKGMVRVLNTKVVTAMVSHLDHWQQCLDVARVCSPICTG